MGDAHHITPACFGIGIERSGLHLDGVDTCEPGPLNRRFGLSKRGICGPTDSPMDRLAESIVADDVSRRIEGRLAAIGTQVLMSRPMSHEMDNEVDESARAQFGGVPSELMVPADVTDTTNSHPEAANSSATSTAYGAPTAHGRMPISRPS